MRIAACPNEDEAPAQLAHFCHGKERRVENSVEE
jgi:hypothetical protein